MTFQPSLFDIADGAQLRDDGIARVTAKSGEWMSKAQECAARFLSTLSGSLTSDEIRDAVREKIGEPHHGNAWGALTRWLILKGYLLRTGRLALSSRASNHAHANPVYEVRSVSNAN